MEIREMLLTNKRAAPGVRITPKGLVIHWTANEGKGADAAANRQYFNRPTTQASAHYIVDDTQIVRCIPENEMAYHVGARTYTPKAVAVLGSYPNNATLGIEMCVNADGDFRKTYRRTVELAADVLKRHGWGVDRLWRHYDITGKNCPAFFVSDEKARQYLGMSAAQAWAKFKDDVQKTVVTEQPHLEQKPVGTVFIEINGKRLSVQGCLRSGVSWLPVRAVAEAVCGKVEWCAATKQVKVNGQDLTETIDNGTAYAPARELAAVLGLDIEWCGQTKTVKLKKGGE
jgi:N-acetylmuramoyl-L-alanine amidase